MPRSAVVLIATRPNSKRLPRKVFRKIAGYSAIEHILTRMIGADLPVVLCVPPDCDDYDYLLDLYSDKINLSIFHGHAESPLHRMADFVKAYMPSVKWVIRITHDDVLIDQQTMLELLDACDADSEIGYGVTPEIVEGAGVEIFRRENLEQAALQHKEPTEFVSYFVKNSPYSKEIKLSPRSSVCRKYRLTMDYEEDWILLDTVLKKVGATAKLDEVVRVIDQNPHLLNINHTPTLSIYTCAYNAEETIGQAVASILWSNRYFDGFEYIFVDDGSTDQTILEASKFMERERPIKIISNEQNDGLAYSSNVALNNARGQYVMRVDADDWVIPGALLELIKTMNATGAGIVYPAYYETDEMGKITCAKDPEENHHAGCALMDKRLINEIRFTSGLRHWDSLDLYNRIKAKGFKIAYYKEKPLWYYRRSSNSLSCTLTKERERSYHEVMKNGQRG